MNFLYIYIFDVDFLCRYNFFDTQWPIYFCAAVSLNIHSLTPRELRNFNLYICNFKNVHSSLHCVYNRMNFFIHTYLILIFCVFIILDTQ